MSVPPNSDVEQDSQLRDELAPSEEEARLAPFGLRLIAFVIDVLFFAILVGIGFLAGKVVGQLAWIFWAIVAVAFIAYISTTVWLMNQTFGKAMTGLRIRRVEGSFEPYSLRGYAWAVGRHTLGYVIADVLLLGAVVALFTSRRRALHDYAFGSEVVLVPSAKPFWERYVDFWDSFFTELDHTKQNKTLRAVVRPWKWLMGMIASISGWFLGPLLIRQTSAAAQSPPASSAPAAKSLSLTAKATLWTATTVATGAAVAGVVAAGGGSSPIENVSVVYEVLHVDRPDTAEIFIMKADGDELTQLTHNHWRDSGPDLFADRKIVYVSEQDGNAEIYVMDADGTNQRRLTREESADWSPDWSPDGERIAFTTNRRGDPEIFIMRADGSDQQAVGTDGNSYGAQPEWSPDGERIAFESGDRDRNIFVADVASAEVSQVTFGGGGQPSWSPDGRLIAFTSDRDGDANIYVVEPGREGERRLTEDSAGDFTPFWTPDGSKILFFSERSVEGRGNDLYAMNPDGSDQEKLTSLQALLDDS